MWSRYHSLYRQQQGLARVVAHHGAIRNPTSIAHCRLLSSRDSGLFSGDGDFYFDDSVPSDVSTEKKTGRRFKKKSKQKQRKKSGKPSYRFVDKARLVARGGDGGQGSLSLFQVGRKRKLRPDGGHGGDGGSVIVVADPQQQTLRFPHPHVQAARGTNGSSHDMYGGKGKNTIVRVPLGVVVRRVLESDEEWDPELQMVRKKTGMEDPEIENPDYWYEDYYEDLDNHDITQESVEEEEEGTIMEEADDEMEDEDDDELDGFNTADDDNLQRESIVLADLDTPGSYVVVARGGKGGFGTCLYKSHNGPLPDVRFQARNAKPQPGEIAYLEMELKMIADLGLVGFPNAGKSSLLNAMCKAAPHVAPYPFTTLHPFLGVIEYRDGFRLRAADIPGLIDGAAQGRGKGHDFLRHIERTKALLYIVDAAAVDGRDPVEALRVLANELLSYGDGDMVNRRALIVANKMDLLPVKIGREIMHNLSLAAHEIGLKVQGDVLGISAGVTGSGLSELSEAMRSIVSRTGVEASDSL